ncbi:restriction endonuclease [Methanosarcina sp.]|uniref:restriction endonuclease n=1 Tax=Methanosarcina sp. TaxID=2213 RepID=UPI003C767F48
MIRSADLVLTSNEGIRTAVQVKRYSSKVSNGAVQEVVAAKGLYKCTQGMVVTNNYFTDCAKQLAKANGIELIDRNELRKLINKISHTVNQDQEWLRHFHRSSSLLNAYLPRIKTDFKNLSYTTLASFDSKIQKAMDENSEYTASSRFVDARKEWGAALLNFNAAGVYSTLHPNGGKICDVTNPEACANLKALLESCFSHLNRTNAAIEVAVLDNLNLNEENYSEERASSIEDTLKLTFK